MFCALSFDDLVPPDIASCAPRNILRCALNDQYIFNVVFAACQRFIDNGLKRECRSFTKATIRGDDQSRIGILNSTDQRVGAKSTEYNGVGRANASAGQHRNSCFWNHRHIDRDAIARTYAKFRERICRFLNFMQHLRVGNRPSVVRLTFKVEGDSFSSTFKNMAIEAVIGGVELSPHKPLGKGSLPI